MIIGISMVQEICLILGQVSFNLLYGRKTSDGYLWSGKRLKRKQLTSWPDHRCAELWEKMGKNAKLKETQKWSYEKPQLDKARKLRRIYFIDPEDKEFKETIWNGTTNNTNGSCYASQDQQEQSELCKIWFTNLFLCLKL